MDQDLLFTKIVEQSNKNRKMLMNLRTQISVKKKEAKQQEIIKYEQFARQYQQLVIFNKQSEEENYRLKKELALIDIEIEELTFRNRMSNSRIKDQNEEIENIKDRTFDIDKQKRKGQLINKEYEQLIAEKKALEKEVGQLEDTFDNKRRKYNMLQEQYQQKQLKKQYLLKQYHKQDELNQATIHKLEAQLKDIKQKVSKLSEQRQREQKTQRNTRSRQVMNEIKEMLLQHKSTYSSHD